MKKTLLALALIAMMPIAAQAADATAPGAKDETAAPAANSVDAAKDAAATSKEDGKGTMDSTTATGDAASKGEAADTGAPAAGSSEESKEGAKKE